LLRKDNDEKTKECLLPAASNVLTSQSHCLQVATKTRHRGMPHCNKQRYMASHML